MSNPMDLLQMYRDFMQNPSQMLSKMGIPTNINTPESAMQYLMDSGRVDQNMYNRAREMARTMQGAPPNKA